MSATNELVACAAAHLRAGGLVAFPTETVYGLGADALNEAAVARVFAAKGRPSHNPLIVHVDGEAMAQGVVERWTGDARKLAAAFWPGPLSIVLPKKPLVPDLVTGGGPNVAVRCPDHALTLRLIAAAGVPLVGPSANQSGRVSPTSAEHVAREFDRATILRDGLRVEAGTGRPRSHTADDILVLDGGPCVRGIESTVVRLPVAIGEVAVVLRQGVISAQQIAAVIGRSVEVFRSHAGEHLHTTPQEHGGLETHANTPHLDSPGLLDRHYAPRTRAFRFTQAQWPEVLDALLDLESDDTAEPRGAVLTIGSRGVPSPHMRIVMPTDADAYASRLYAALREADDLKCTAIYVEMPKDIQDPTWAAIADRIGRATEPMA